MAGSCAEEAIRSDLEDWLHQHMPAARVIHELVVGGCRADVAAVERDRITLFEIKSERDTLDRLDEQIRQFSRASHSCVIVAAREWFDEVTCVNRAPGLVWSHGIYAGVDVWCHPSPKEFPLYSWRDLTNAWGRHRWPPQTMYLLDLLWRDELCAEADLHRLSHGKRATKSDLMRSMWDLMTGREITAAVCRRLRARTFPRADVPISGEVAS